MVAVKPTDLPERDPVFAEIWCSQLETWISEHGLLGHDRFDVREHPLIRAAQPHPLLRKVATAVTDGFPVFSRKMLGIAPQFNAKAFALVATGHLRLHQTFGGKTHLAQALEHLQWLLEHPSTGWHGLCWGYPFDVSARGLSTPKYTPVGVVSAIAGEGFIRAYQITGNKAHLATARSIAEFFLRDLPRFEATDGTCCFAYTPTDGRRVHNASLHAASHLLRVYAETGESELHDAAWPAVQFTLARQHEDGSWPYGEHLDGEPFEAKSLSLVDHHHTGFVLRSLFEIQGLGLHSDEDASIGLSKAILRGFAFYRKNLFAEDGCPVTLAGRYPVDIHACAEGMLCPSLLSAWQPDALALATRTMYWTSRHLRNPKNGLPYYRQYPGFVSKLHCPRWGLAWIFLALSEYRAAVHRAENTECSSA